MIKLKKNGDILYNNTQVGILQWNGNTLMDIFIEKQYRRNGYASEAINQMIDYIKKERYEYIKTTTVINTHMEKILDNKGFKPVNNVEIDFIESDSIISEDTAPIQNNNCWILIFD